ncbi:hypothetical protein [Belnapia moabensis]|uniref:hypothetical protein n=1 Tax=Belnapia moabensis TaxID=365533 RepID=UPI0005B7CA0D|nr:hypothetical protein [Belnapia moabensis]
MEVSNFELLLKPQSPAAPSGSMAVDRVLQGYFLEITNLEPVPLRYALEFVIFPPPAGTPNQAFRSLAGNTLCIVDTGGTDNRFGVLNGSLASSVFTPRFPTVSPSPFPAAGDRLITVPAGGTALVAVLPSAFGVIDPIEPTPLVMPNFEVRGFVRIRLPPIFRRPFPFFGRQLDRPARTLLTPQNRATFLTAAGAISDQTQTSLPLASGKALNEIVPETFTFLPLATSLGGEDRTVLAAEYLQNIPLEIQADLLAMLLARLPEDADLPEFNRALAALDIPHTVERRRKSGQAR